MRELAQSYLDHSRSDHRIVLNRKQLIEARKEYIESESKAKASQRRIHAQSKEIELACFHTHTHTHTL